MNAIRPYRPSDHDALYTICIRTGDAGRDATALYPDPRILPDIFVGPYLLLEPELTFVLVDTEDRPAGYMVGAADTPQWTAWPLLAHWAPTIGVGSQPRRLSMSMSNERDQVVGLTAGTLLAAALAVCVAQVALAIPAVLNGLFQEDLGPTSSQLTWISDAFLVPVTLLELTFGVLGDLFGRKRLLVGGALLLGLGEFIAVLTPGAAASTGTRVLILWIGQIIAGIGAAALFPTSLALVAAGTHTAGHRARSITIWAPRCPRAAPSPGARWPGDEDQVRQRSAWQLAVGVHRRPPSPSSVRRCRPSLAKNSSAPEGRSLDWPGQITIAVSLFTLLFAVIQGPTSGWGSAEVVGGFILAVVFLALFIVVESRSPAPLLRLNLFRNRAFTISAIITVFGMFSFLGTAYTTSIRMSAIQGFTPLRTSIAFVLLNGIALVQMPFTRRALERYDPRWILGVGSA